MRWSTTLGGPVKSAPAYYGGTLYVGDYGGDMNAVDAKTGELKWQSGSLGHGFGASGEFYSTPAVAFGRVYAGNNDGRIYSYRPEHRRAGLDPLNRRLRLFGAVVANTKHSPPTVYIGSFDGNVYALNAKNGETSLGALGRRPGRRLALGVGEIVYVAEFSDGSTNGYKMKTGRQVFHLQDRHLQPGDLRRPSPLPRRLLEHQCPSAYKYKAGRCRTGSSPPAVKPRPHSPRAHRVHHRHHTQLAALIPGVPQSPTYKRPPTAFR